MRNISLQISGSSLWDGLEEEYNGDSEEANGACRECRGKPLQVRLKKSWQFGVYGDAGMIISASLWTSLYCGAEWVEESNRSGKPSHYLSEPAL